MAKYFTEDVLNEIDEIRIEIYKNRDKIFSKYDIDVLDTDTLSSIAVYKKISRYDKNYNINLARNGEDAMSNGVDIEQKCCKVKKTTSKASFMFHAMGNLEYDRYILVVRKEDTLDIIRIYDISSTENISIIHKHLLEERKKWLEKGRIDQSKMKRDVITIPETLLKKLPVTEYKLLDDCCVSIL